MPLQRTVDSEAKATAAAGDLFEDTGQCQRQDKARSDPPLWLISITRGITNQPIFVPWIGSLYNLAASLSH